MAKKTTSKSGKAPKKDTIEDEMPAPETAAPESETPYPLDQKVSPDDAKAMDSATKGQAGETATPEDASAHTAMKQDEPEETDAPTDQSDVLEKDVASETPKPAPVAQAPERPSAMPLLLGGIAAGALGFAAAYFGLAQQPDARGVALAKQIQEVSQTLEDQSNGLNALTEEVATLSDGPDMAPIAEQLTGLTDAIANLSERIVAAEKRLGAFETQLRQVEQRPVTEGASEAAVAAYEQELHAAREEIASQRTELEALIENALSKENAAEGAAQAAMRRAATSRILSALDSGAPFAAALADLQATGAEVPDALTTLADTGVASLSDLQERFPSAARDALSASRAVSANGGGLSAFLRTQLGARSLEPREGNDPDAILSRSEAALRDGRLADVLAELEELPEEGRAELSDWARQVAQRMDAVNAAQSLSETVN